MNLDAADTYAAGIAALFGGVGVKILEKMMNKRSEQFLEGAKIRQELRLEITKLRNDVEELRKEVDEWRTKYYEQIEENLTLNQNFEQLRIELQRQQILLSSGPELDPTKEKAEEE